jgi:hypothetical protein
MTFSAEPGNNQIIAAANFSTLHQTGEGDHGVLQISGYLYLFFLEWDGWRGDATVGLARSPVSSRGRPGTWLKLKNGRFTEPGIGGDVDMIHAAGTAPAAIADLHIILTVGLSSGPIVATYRDDDGLPPITGWAPAPGGPIFVADYSSWNRQPNSSELFGYVSVMGDSGNALPIMSNQAYIYFTYLEAGATFASRYLVRRRCSFFTRLGQAPLPSLEALSLWCVYGRCAETAWPTTGPVLGNNWSATQGEYKLSSSVLAYLFTASLNESSALIECMDPRTGRMTLMTAQECVAANGKRLRPAGWVAASEVFARTLGWVFPGALQPAEQAVYRSDAVQLWRCVGEGEFNYSVAVGNGEAGCAPRRVDVLLGFALSPFTISRQERFQESTPPS